jgi:hypothetical protein
LLAESTADNDATKHPKLRRTIMTTINKPISPSGIISMTQLEELETKIPDYNYLASDLREAQESGDPERIEQIKSLITDQLTMEN